MIKNLFESAQSIDTHFPEMTADDLVLDKNGQSNSGKSGRGVRMNERVRRPELTEEETAKFLRIYDAGELYHNPDSVPYLDGQELFEDDSLVQWDYGCGRGERIIALASANPTEKYVGVDIHLASLLLGVKAAAAAGVDNVRFIKSNNDLLIPRIPNGSSNGASVLFPAPIPKSNGTFEGVPSPQMVGQIHRTLETGGSPFEIASDSEPYFNYRLRQIGVRGLFSLNPEEFGIGIGQDTHPTRYQKVWETKDIPTRSAVMRKIESDTTS